MLFFPLPQPINPPTTLQPAGQHPPPTPVTDNFFGKATSFPVGFVYQSYGEREKRNELMGVAGEELDTVQVDRYRYLKT